MSKADAGTLAEKKKKVARKLGKKGSERVYELGELSAILSSRGRTSHKTERALSHIYRNDPDGYGKAYKKLTRDHGY